MAYNLLLDSGEAIENLEANIDFFKSSISANTLQLISSTSAIQCMIAGSNERAREIAQQLQNAGLDVRPILNPTVPKGSERIRICLHSFNTTKEIAAMTDIINQF
jgi:8-amino-7-oxononanoate synthase